jgi:hypothetical protein
LKPKIISKIISIIKIEKIIAQEPNIIFSKSDSYFVIIFFNKTVNAIISIIFKTLGSEDIVSILKHKLINKEKKL